MADDIVGSARIRVSLEDDGAVPEARSLGRRIERAIESATRDAGGRMRREGENAGEQFIRGVDGRLRDARGRFVREGSLLGRVLSAAFGRGFSGVSLFVEAVEESASGLSRLVVGAGALGALGALAIGLASATTAAVGLSAAFAPAAGILAALPAGVLLFQSALGTLRLALLGVGEAFEAELTEDAAKFEESLEGLAPAALAVARELRAARPEIDAFRQSVQGAFFAPLRREITSLVAALRGPLTTGMRGSAAELGRLALATSRWLRSASGVGLIEGLFARVRSTLAGIRTNTVDRLLRAITDFTVGTLPAFDGLGASLDGILLRFSRFLERATAAGDGIVWIYGALEVFRQLGAIVGDVGGILVGVFDAAEQAGGSALGVIARVLDQARAFVESTEGQAALVEVFSALGEVGGQLGPILGALIIQLGSLGSIVGDLALITGPLLVTAINEIGAAARAWPGRDRRLLRSRRGGDTDRLVGGVDQPCHGAVGDPFHRGAARAGLRRLGRRASTGRDLRGEPAAGARLAGPGGARRALLVGVRAESADGRAQPGGVAGRPRRVGVHCAAGAAAGGRVRPGRGRRSARPDRRVRRDDGVAAAPDRRLNARVRVRRVALGLDRHSRHSRPARRPVGGRHHRRCYRPDAVR
ncbi:hypothetical protein ACTWPT_13485 [Nonomuraea sp. 3N208]|uniref:hypothetical protein n=1 Tax=Nonomuraea sp. 3N208 TaxID=3457421 RepID=UPI003FCEC766